MSFFSTSSFFWHRVTIWCSILVYVDLLIGYLKPMFIIVHCYCIGLACGKVLSASMSSVLMSVFIVMILTFGFNVGVLDLRYRPPFSTHSYLVFYHI